METKKYEYDVALSFAGEDRSYVEQVANILRINGVKVFYDLFDEVNLWGKNLYEYLSEIYQARARYTIMFISKYYNSKLWTNHERKSMQARAFRESQEYILPARFDQTEIPGVLTTVGYVNLQNKTPETFALMIEKKLIMSGIAIPNERLKYYWTSLKSFSNAKPFETVVHVCDGERIPVPDAQVMLIDRQGTVLSGITNQNGDVHITIPSRRKYTVLITHSLFSAKIIRDYDPMDTIEVKVSSIPNVGSIIVRSSGYIPGLSGKIQVSPNARGRKWLRSDTIIFNKGKNAIPVEPDKVVLLNDMRGMVTGIKVAYTRQSVMAIDYSRPMENVS